MTQGTRAEACCVASAAVLGSGRHTLLVARSAVLAALHAALAPRSHIAAPMGCGVRVAASAFESLDVTGCCFKPVHSIHADHVVRRALPLLPKLVLQESISPKRVFGLVSLAIHFAVRRGRGANGHLTLLSLVLENALAPVVAPDDARHFSAYSSTLQPVP